MTMEPNSTEGLSPAYDQKFRELSQEKVNQQAAEVPKTGNESSVKVTKSEDDLDLGGLLKTIRKLKYPRNTAKNPANRSRVWTRLMTQELTAPESLTGRLLSRTSYPKNLHPLRCTTINTGTKEASTVNWRIKIYRKK